MEVRDEIEAAFRRLPLKADTEMRMQAIVNILSEIARSVERVGEVPTNSINFLPAGRGAVEKEIASLRRMAIRVKNSRSRTKARRAVTETRFLALLDALHQPAIIILANAGFLRFPRDPQQLAARLLQINPDLSEIPDASATGARRKLLAADVARLLAYEFSVLTDHRPTVATDWDSGKAHGSFLNLVREVFQILHIRANPERAARNVIQQWRENTIIAFFIAILSFGMPVR